MPLSARDPAEMSVVLPCRCCSPHGDGRAERGLVLDPDRCGSAPRRLPAWLGLVGRRPRSVVCRRSTCRIRPVATRAWASRRVSAEANVDGRASISVRHVRSAAFRALQPMSGLAPGLLATGSVTARRLLRHPGQVISAQDVRSEQRVLFVLWALVGAGACLAVLGVLSIGYFVAPVVALGAWLLLRLAKPDRGMSGAISGVSLMLLFVAWQNRSGPGAVCKQSTNFSSCAEQWNPLPWLVSGLGSRLSGGWPRCLLRAGTDAPRRVKAWLNASHAAFPAVVPMAGRIGVFADQTRAVILTGPVTMRPGPTWTAPAGRRAAAPERGAPRRRPSCPTGRRPQ